MWPGWLEEKKKKKAGFLAIQPLCLYPGPSVPAWAMMEAYSKQVASLTSRCHKKSSPIFSKQGGVSLHHSASEAIVWGCGGCIYENKWSVFVCVCVCKEYYPSFALSCCSHMCHGLIFSKPPYLHKGIYLDPCTDLYRITPVYIQRDTLATFHWTCRWHVYHTWLYAIHPDTLDSFSLFI